MSKNARLVISAVLGIAVLTGLYFWNPGELIQGKLTLRPVIKPVPVQIEETNTAPAIISLKDINNLKNLKVTIDQPRGDVNYQSGEELGLRVCWEYEITKKIETDINQYWRIAIKPTFDGDALSHKEIPLDDLDGLEYRMPGKYAYCNDEFNTPSQDTLWDGSRSGELIELGAAGSYQLKVNASVIERSVPIPDNMVISTPPTATDSETLTVSDVVSEEYYINYVRNFSLNLEPVSGGYDVCWEYDIVDYDVPADGLNTQKYWRVKINPYVIDLRSTIKKALTLSIDNEELLLEGTANGGVPGHYEVCGYTVPMSSIATSSSKSSQSSATGGNYAFLVKAQIINPTVVRWEMQNVPESRVYGIGKYSGYFTAPDGPKAAARVMVNP